MPMIDLTYVRGSLDDQARRRLTDELVTSLLRAERAPDTPFLRDNTLVYLHELDPAAQSVGGRGQGAPRFRVEMTVFGGALTKGRKEQLAADVHVAVCGAAGIDPDGEQAFHVWTLIHEIPEGNWAGGGGSSTTGKSKVWLPTTHPDRVDSVSVRLWTSLVRSPPHPTPQRTSYWLSRWAIGERGSTTPLRFIPMSG